MERDTTGLLHGAFIDQARRKPGRIALKENSLSITYGALLERARRLAFALDAAIPDSNPRPIALCGAKSWRAVEAIIAVLMTGRAYSFLCPNQRAARLQKMTEQMRPSLVVDLHSSEWDHDPFAISAGSPVIALPEDLPERPSDPRHPRDGAAYCFFTSGSTGSPKGVVVGHNASRLAQKAFIKDTGVGENDNVCSEMAFCFDVSTIDIFATLAVGATLDVTPETVIRDPTKLAHHLVANNITSLFTCPTAARMLLEVDTGLGGKLQNLKLSLTGELLSERLSKLIAPMVLGNRVWNQYGATEYPFGLSCRLQPDDLAEANVVFAASAENPVHVRLSDTGEFVLNGPGLFSGYVTPQTDFGGPLKQVDFFVTADRAEPVGPGKYRLLGRADRQCRKDGYRIELREIECAAEAHQDIDLCYATYDAAENAIVAHVKSRRDQHCLDREAVLSHLKHRLPDYMLPDHVRILADAPRTLSGKKQYSGLRELELPS